MHTAAFLQYLEREKQAIIDHCTLCGKCVEVCPMPQYDAVLHHTDPVRVVAGIIEVLRTARTPFSCSFLTISVSR